jgi:hypothetical protein
MAHWHAMAKLRLHNDLTLAVMDAITVSLGEKLRSFGQNTCSAFATKDLRKEYNARLRRDTKKAAFKAATDQVTGDSEITEAQPTVNSHTAASTTIHGVCPLGRGS